MISRRRRALDEVRALGVPGAETIAGLLFEGWRADAGDTALMVIARVEGVGGRVIAQAEERARCPWDLAGRVRFRLLGCAV
ncbi:hypothetical protein NITHO_3310030 [Nitrolancea hollandica Lb]|uniref:Uncharacterized protein n=1 Tax=Nitrolancea hollandica Lb TaxID=1129897 RepID=I4EI01_9BACT|nr:hypothetical protein NITHO_3310030 [Nitrolancea hollandica Lb]